MDFHMKIFKALTYGEVFSDEYQSFPCGKEEQNRKSGEPLAIHSSTHLADTFGLDLGYPFDEAFMWALGAGRWALACRPID